MTDQLTPEALRAIDLAQKLLEVKGCTEAEAQSRVAKALAILEKHGLDMSAAEKANGAGPSKRDDKTGGTALYKWQRDVWHAVAELNFCVHFANKGLTRGSKYEHRIVGKAENVIGTRIMAEYLCSTINRHAQDWAKDRGYNVFCSDAIAFREGMGARIVERLQELRKQRYEEDARKAREEAMRSKHPGAASSGTALTLVDVKQSEEDANKDYLNGWEPGTAAAIRARDDAARYAQKLENERYQTQWEAFQGGWTRSQFEAEWADEGGRRWTHFEDYRRTSEARVAKQRADDERRERRRETMIANGTYREPKGRPEPSIRYRNMTKEELRRESSAFGHGHAKGNDVGLDRQVDETRKNRIG